MARNTTLRVIRNEAIRKRFRTLRKSNPKWMVTAILEQLSTEFYLEEVTIAKILSETSEAVPAASTISRNYRPQMQKTAAA